MKLNWKKLNNKCFTAMGGRMSLILDDENKFWDLHISDKRSIMTKVSFKTLEDGFKDSLEMVKAWDHKLFNVWKDGK